MSWVNGLQVLMNTMKKVTSIPITCFIHTVSVKGRILRGNFRQRVKGISS